MVRCRIFASVALLSLAGPRPVQAQTTPAVRDSQALAAVFNLGAWSGRVLNQPYWGLNLGFRMYAMPRVSAGLQLAASFQHRTPTSFQYVVAEPVLEYGQLGLLVQYDVVQARRFRLGLALVNGLVTARLGDNAEKQTYWNGHTYTRRAKEVETDYFYLLQPGFDLLYRIAGGPRNGDLYLNVQAGYRLLAGGARFATLGDFTGPATTVGFSVMGLAGSKARAKKAASPPKD